MFPVCSVHGALVTMTATCDNILGVYIDGTPQASLPGANSWTSNSVFTFDDSGCS